MTREEIEIYLSQKNEVLDTEAFNDIEKYRLSAIKQKNENDANYYWCLKQIYIVQQKFLSAFNSLQTKKYKSAWMLFDEADIELCALEENFDISINNDQYSLIFIGHIIKLYQKLFPYRFFLSREGIIKKEKCSICGATISLRNGCNHKVGKLYMGEMCYREVVDYELIAISIVKDPFDKYALIEVKGSEYSYVLLEWLMKYIKHPYDEFNVSITRVKKPEYQNIGRNDPCPCKSNKKYKYCHCNTEDELMDHYAFSFPKYINAKPEPIQYFNGIEVKK